jgi:serine/threonine-protein kinase
LQYVAPEALSGELVDGRADIYSLAKITYYMLTGKNPHEGRSPRELFQQLLSGTATPLSQARKDLKFAPALEAAVMKGLSRQPADRQPTVTAFAEELEAAFAQNQDPKSRGWFGALRNIVGKRDSE